MYLLMLLRVSTPPPNETTPLRTPPPTARIDLKLPTHPVFLSPSSLHPIFVFRLAVAGDRRPIS